MLERTYDVIGIFFDLSKASYYGYGRSDSNYVSLKNVQNKDNGTVLFNYYDNRGLLCYLYDQWISVYVQNTGSFSYGADYNHTYMTTSSSISGSASITFSGTGQVSGL